MLSVRVTWYRPSDLRRDVEQQMARGGLLLRVSPDMALNLNDEIQVELVLPDKQRVAGIGRVLHAMQGGVAVALAATEVAAVWRTLISQGQDPADAGPPRHEIVTPQSGHRQDAGGASRAGPANSGIKDSVARYADLTTGERIKLAMQGDHDERAAVLRDRNLSLHAYVLKNPRVRPEEVAGMARNAQVSPELLRQIGERKEWLSQPEIAAALARNPKTPSEVATRALGHVSQDALRQIAKGNNVPPAVAVAARKRVLGS